MDAIIYRSHFCIQYREKKMLEAERRRKQEDEMRYKKLQEQVWI